MRAGGQEKAHILVPVFPAHFRDSLLSSQCPLLKRPCVASERPDLRHCCAENDASNPGVLGHVWGPQRCLRRQWDEPSVSVLHASAR